MTDPQLPPPVPNGSVPPVPPAPTDAPPAYDAPAFPEAAPQPPVYQAPPAQAPAPAYPTPPPAPGYPAPSYQAPPASVPQAPPGAYTAPVGGYGAPAGAYQSPAPAPRKPATLGIIAFVVGIVAAVVAPILGGISGYQVGFGLPSVMNQIDRVSDDLSFLSPVRDQVLLGEIGFWLGTLAGIAAIVVGIMAIAKRQGRGWGITALILGVIGAAIFFIVLSVMLGIGASAGAVDYYGT